jgi:HEAT repeat protein
MWEGLALIGSIMGLLMGAQGLWNLGALLSVRRDSRRRLEVWEHVAAFCRLEVKEVSNPSARRLKLAARRGPMAVRIAGTCGLEDSIEVVVAVSGPPGFSEMSLHREPRKPLPWVQEIGIGDEPFDSTFYIGGPMRLVCALLDAETRGLLVSVNAECRLELFGGELQAETSDWKLSYVLPRLVTLGRRFSQPRDLTFRLARNARRDPAAGVRLQNLRFLALESPGDPRTVKTLRKACSDASPKVRLWAARELGAEGRDVLRQLAESEEDDDCSAQAISALSSALPFETTRAILLQALRGRHVQTARACVEALGRSGTAAAVEDLAKVMAREKGELAVAAVQALGTTGNTAAEPPLIQALQHSTAEVQVAAAKGLGRLGSAAAVLPLKEAAESFSHDPELVLATRQAIAEVQSRLRGASPGQLSLAGAETGQLSLAPTESGELSLAPADPAGQLSLPPEEPET